MIYGLQVLQRGEVAVVMGNESVTHAKYRQTIICAVPPASVWPLLARPSPPFPMTSAMARARSVKGYLGFSIVPEKDDKIEHLSYLARWFPSRCLWCCEQGSGYRQSTI